jgi:hypothetical protein
MYLKSVTLESVKSFPSLHFDFERPLGKFAGWTVFVGGNSSGKSTLLKSIALAIMGAEAGSPLMGSTQGWITNGHAKATATTRIKWDQDHDTFKRGGKLPGASFDAGVRWFMEQKEDVVPKFRAVDQRIGDSRVLTAHRGPWSPNARGWFAAGYGPMRRLTGSSSESMRYTLTKEVESRFVTLFREDAALSESEEWLRRMYARGLESETDEIKQLLDGVKKLLNDGLLPNGMRIARLSVDHVYIKDARDVELPMRDISDGCRSIYATILDLVHGMFEVYGIVGLFSVDATGRTYVNRPGVVIIDEIEAHLHPSWQREIPDWLKTHFPLVQFLVSSHSPLIAQAADPNGLFILPLQNDLYQKPRPATEVEYEKVRWGSAHQTVLGVAFGLETGRTKWAANQLERWQVLNSKKQSGAKLYGQELLEYKALDVQIEKALDGAPPETLTDENIA